MDASSPSMKVKCGVDTCQYYKDNMCHANGIEVNAMGDGIAETSDGTCCSTFVSGGDNKR